MRVLRSPDRRWRAEQRVDGWWLFYDGALIASRTCLDHVVLELIDAGADPTTLVED